MRHRIWIVLLAGGLLLTPSCADDPKDDGSSDRADTWIVEDTGFDVGADAASDISEEPAPDISEPEDIKSTPDIFDSGVPDVESDVDADSGPTYRTIADYRRCRSDVDCPVGLGGCVTSVSLNRADSDGTELVAIDAIFPDLREGEGVCTLVCTNGRDVCADLSVNGNTPDTIAHTCQLVVVGEAPYPADLPAFPFDEQLDSSEQVPGQPFGAICRPPFQLDAGVEDSFGAACEMPEGCASPGALCFNFVTMAEALDGETGACLTPCADDTGCALGFFCDASDARGDTFCRPELDTFGPCQDVDGDGFGTGLCADGPNPVTPHDCDDRNPNAYFDPDNPEHPFPTFCGDFDYNCNGLSDRAEQVGAAVYPEAHCASCFDVCEGAVPNGQKTCRTVDTTTRAAACQATCEDISGDGKPDFADCDGDLTNGCEVPVDDPTRLYYRDADGDGYGDPDDIKFACDPAVVPPGYVDNDFDCDDTSSLVYGGPNPAKELCDGLDNNCDGKVDELSAFDQAGQACNSPESGVCKPGAWVCGGAEGWACVSNIAPGALSEICDGFDNNCDGQVDGHWTGTTPPSVASGYKAYYPDADGDGDGDASAEPLYACAQPIGYVDDNGDCDDRNAQANSGMVELCSTAFDDNCDGRTNEGTATDAVMYYPDGDGDGYGATGEGTMFCDPPPGWVLRDGDCDDTNPDANPGMIELCTTAFDDNCDGRTNENWSEDFSPPAQAGYALYYRDEDRDQYGDLDDFVYACSQPAGYVTEHHSGQFDCDDSDAAISPIAPEVCNGVDDNCNDTVDGGCPDGTTSTSPEGELKAVLGYPHSSGGGNILCDDGEVIVGMSLYKGKGGGAYHNDLYKLEPICAPITVESHGQPGQGAFTYTLGHGPKTSTMGDFGIGPGHQKTPAFVCPAGEAIYKVKAASSDIMVRKLIVYCRKFLLDTTPDSEAAPYSLSTDINDTSQQFFGEANYGTGTFSQCNSNQAVSGLRINFGRSGSWWGTRMVRLYCKDVELGTK